ncbi:M16 family metallopeptidase [Alistipes sp.]|uniref:M16 family metallopeptidase n=1 Tax=Alistipes sp. TaxID=1872444 RepID=UPI003AF11291
MKRSITVLFALFAALTVTAQPSQQELQRLMGPIPADQEVRTGRLDNGLTYYVRHNEKPKGQAEFYILHNVGAIQESDDQQGLAHFLEHMAFNGTKNLPGKMLTEYLEKVGVKFGANLNAATSWDHTVYNISSVPTTREGIIDSALLILHDWSHFITLDPKEIDSERGVIMEELRTRDGAGWRSSIEMLKSLGKGTRYEHRNLIGYLDFLKSFEHRALADFYHQWYRPDYQAIVVVGDLDAEAVEAKIKRLMSDIPAPAPDASQKETIVVPDNEEPIVSIFTDKEMQSSVAKLFIKHRALPDEMNDTGTAQMLNVLKTFLTVMENNRLGEIAMKSDAPFLGASMGIGGIGLIPTLECVTFAVQTQDGKLLEGFEALLTEMEKIRRHGFTQSEFDRVKQDLMRGTERAYTTRKDRRNGSFVQTYLSNYRNNTAMPDAETSWKVDSTLINMARVELVNQLAATIITPENRVLTVTAPEKEGLTTPTAEEFIAVMDKVAAAEVEQHEDTLVIEPLIAEGTVLKGSPVKKTSRNERYGYTEWTLKNGARILVKPTTFKTDEIRMSALMDGGTSVLTDDEYYTGKVLESVISFSGIGRFPAVELQKQLTGKVASASLSINEFSNGIGAACSPQDLETMMQLVYLNLTEPRFDRDDYDRMMTLLRAQIENARANPDYEMQERFLKLVYSDHFRRQMITPEILDRMDYDQLPAIYRKLYPGVRGMTFIFVGNIDPDTLRPLVEKYIGSVADQKKPLNYVDDKVRPIEGMHTEDFRTPMQQPKVSVSYHFSGDMEYSLRNRLVMTLLTQALDSRYQESIREEKGGTYGVSVSGSTSRIPFQGYTMQIGFDTNEEMADELREIVMKELEEMAQNGPRTEDIEKTREYLQKNWKTGLEQNGSWMAYIQNYVRYNTDYLADYERLLRELTNDDVRQLMRKILDDGNRIEVIMRPEAREAEPDAQPAPAKPAE